MADDDVTLGELRRDMHEMQRYNREAMADMQRSVNKISESLSSLPYVRQDVYEERQKTTGERLGKLEGIMNKINYVAWTAIVLPITMMIVAALLAAAINYKP